MKGRVIWWNPKDGCGFIEIDGKNIFAHQIEEDSIELRDDLEIEFESIETKKGLFIRCIS